MSTGGDENKWKQNNLKIVFHLPLYVQYVMFLLDDCCTNARVGRHACRAPSGCKDVWIWDGGPVESLTWGCCRSSGSCSAARGRSSRWASRRPRPTTTGTTRTRCCPSTSRPWPGWGCRSLKDTGGGESLADFTLSQSKGRKRRGGLVGGY